MSNRRTSQRVPPDTDLRARLGIRDRDPCYLRVRALRGRLWTSPTPTAPDVPPSLPSPAEQARHSRRGRRTRSAARLPARSLAFWTGPLAGTTQLTDDAGKFELSARATGMVSLRASRDGFESSTEAASWQPSTSIRAVEVQFWLDTLEPPIGGPRAGQLHADNRDRPRDGERPQGDSASPPRGVPRRSRVAHVSSDHQGSASASYLSDRIVTDYDRLGFWFSVAGRFVGFEMDSGIPRISPDSGF